MDVAKVRRNGMPSGNRNLTDPNDVVKQIIINIEAGVEVEVTITP